MGNSCVSVPIVSKKIAFYIVFFALANLQTILLYTLHIHTLIHYTDLYHTALFPNKSFLKNSLKILCAACKGPKSHFSLTLAAHYCVSRGDICELTKSDCALIAVQGFTTFAIFLLQRDLSNMSFSFRKNN